jgi:dUTP pyrophosphatase
MSDITVSLMRLPHGADLPLPAYQSDAASGLDLLAAVPADAPLSIAPGRHAAVTVLNTPGTIDADYRGEIQILLINHGDAPFVITRGMRIAQLVMAAVTRVRLAEVIRLDETARGVGGFGSTGAGGG